MGLPILNALSPSSSTFDFSTTRASTPVVRPDSPILAGSCYVQGTQHVATDIPSTQVDGVESTALGLDMPKDSDSARSLSSLDQVFRHRDEVNKRIAALQEFSPPCSVLYGGFGVLDPPQTDVPASTTPSNNSILSLSVFPDPPSNLQGFFHNISRSSFLSTETLQPCLLHGGLEPMSAQWDVTSFIRSESWIINLVYRSLCIFPLDLTVTDSTSGRVMVASMYTESGVGPSFPRTYSQLITSPILELCPAEGDDHESLEPKVEWRIFDN